MPIKSFSRWDLQGLDPRLNLPSKFRGSDPEASFLRLFQEAYLSSLKRRGVAYRDFPLQGFGIADLIWLSWKHESGATILKLKKNPARLSSKRLTAFELKLVDWRRGMMQAYRYSYFANRSILVIPPTLEEKAKQRAVLFKAMRVGLWIFDPATSKIRKIVTPSYGRPRNKDAYKKAIASLGKLV